MDFHMKIFYNPVITILAQIPTKELNDLVTGFFITGFSLRPYYLNRIDTIYY